MDSEQAKRVVEILINAMERVVEKKDATPIETEALCKIASVLTEFAKNSQPSVS